MPYRRRQGRFMVAIAKKVYRAMPWLSVRKAYFALFLRLVRGRRAVATVEGLTYDLDLSEMIDVGVYLQEYERDIARVIEHVCRPGWVVLDIGANIGAHTLRCAKLAGPTGHVFAFEPTDYAYRKLTRNISLNSFGNIDAVRLALWETNVDGGTISVRSSWPSDGRRVIATNAVDFRRLDDWCAERSVDRVNLIKLDVDGSEFAILAGARRALERSRPILLMEVGACHFKAPSRNPLMMLRELGYRFWDTRSLGEYESPDAIGRRLPPVDDEMTVSLNVIAAMAWPEAVRGDGGDAWRSS